MHDLVAYERGTSGIGKALPGKLFPVAEELHVGDTPGAKLTKKGGRLQMDRRIGRLDGGRC